MDNANYSQEDDNMQGIDPELKFVLELLESSSEYRPYFDPDFKVLIVEESEIPIMIMNRRVFDALERKIIGDI